MDTGRRLLGLIALAACGGSSPPPASTRIGPAVIAGIEAAPRAPWRCAAPEGPKLVEEALGAWQLGAHAMTRDEGGTITIGVIADAGGAAPQTMAALGRLRAKLDGVDLVLALGGMAGSQKDLEAVLGAIADRASWPLVVLPGDLEPVTGLVAAITALRAKGQLVVDGRLAHRLELQGGDDRDDRARAMPSRLVAGSDSCRIGGRPVTRRSQISGTQGQPDLASVEAPRIG